LPEYLYPLILFFLPLLTGYILTPHFARLFYQGNRLAKNYRGELIPQGVGIVFSLCSLPWYILYLLVDNLSGQWVDPIMVLILLTAFLTATMMGFMDDMLGSRDTLGLKGHFRSLLDGRLTTGMIKALGGLLVSLLISIFFSSNFGEIIINTFLIAHFTNFLNLLDLRPGRAIKFYIFLFLIFSISAFLRGSHYSLVLMLPLLGSILGYFPFDLKARCMMGDGGSNLLGISTGILAVMQTSYNQRIIILLFLILIHAFAEQYSLTDLIKKNRVLSFFDNLGRQRV
jgi:UDP-GlcNAc:undecaprenyl-phosphate GlcNAc-1-phosphate transferase